MSMIWKCDLCGQETVLNPPVEPQFEEKEVETLVPKVVKKKVKDTDGNEQELPVIEHEKIVKKQKVPVMATSRFQDPATGDMKDVQVQATKDLKPRTFVVRVSVNHEAIQKDFCKVCFEEKVKPQVKELFTTLENIKSK